MVVINKYSRQWKKKFRIPPKKRTFAILIISPDDRADIDR
jgi:hypothetical protein